MFLGLGLAMSAGAGGFVPTDIGGCVLWLDARQTVSSGGLISAWTDLSGSSNTPSASSNKPTLSATGGATGGPAVVYGAAQSLDLAAAPFNTNSFTLFLVLKGSSSSNSGFAFTCGSGSTGVSVGIGVVTGSKREANWNGVATSDDSTNNATTSWEKWTLTGSSAPAQTLRVNGSAHTINNNATTTIAPSAAMNVGSRAGAVNWNGSISHVIAYNTVLSAGNIALVEAYLASVAGV